MLLLSGIPKGTTVCIEDTMETDDTHWQAGGMATRTSTSTALGRKYLILATGKQNSE